MLLSAEAMQPQNDLWAPEQIFPLSSEVRLATGPAQVEP